ncbi:MAG: hypothetical protein GX348_07540 [Veillonellaceae bacterium]|nr:hypothetical protein [Veillonellaceae bacterium]
MRVAIISNERITLEQLEHYLKKIPNIEVAAGLTKPAAVYKILRETNPGLVVLDIEIEMPEMNGLLADEELSSIQLSKRQRCAAARNTASLMPVKLKKIFALDGSESIILLNADEIELFMLEGRDVIVVSGSKRYKTRYSLNYWEERLGGQSFFRCHKSYLINLDKIKKLKPMFNGTYLLEFDNYQGEVAVSRSRARVLEDVLGL